MHPALQGIAASQRPKEHSGTEKGHVQILIFATLSFLARDVLLYVQGNKVPRSASRENMLQKCQNVAQAWATWCGWGRLARLLWLLWLLWLVPALSCLAMPGLAWPSRQLRPRVSQVSLELHSTYPSPSPPFLLSFDLAIYPTTPVVSSPYTSSSHGMLAISSV